MDKVSWSFLRKSILFQMKQEAQCRILLSRTVWFSSNSFSGSLPYLRMDRRKIANLLQQGYRMLKPQHVDDELWAFFPVFCLIRTIRILGSYPPLNGGLIKDIFQVPDHDQLLEKWPGCETNIYWFKKSAERHGNPAPGETCGEHNNLCLSFHVRENESLAACSLQINNDLFRCPKSTYWSLLIGIIPISVSFHSCHRGSTTGIVENSLSRVLFFIESLKISTSKISDNNRLCWLNKNGLDYFK